jgi:hypothetical protein
MGKKDIGNPVSQSKNNAAKFAEFNKSKPLPAPIVNKGKDNFDLSTVQQNVQPFDIKSGIKSESPEIVLFSEFSPAYDDSGNLTSLGELLENKQNAILVSANSSVDSIINSTIYEDIDSELENNKKSIFDFCSRYSSKIFELLGLINAIKKQFDCRYPADDSSLKKLGIGGVNDYGYPMSIEEFLSEDSSTISRWSSTKTWIQCCLQLKDYLKNGSMDGVLSDSTPTHNASTSNAYKSPYNFFSPKSVNVKRFGFKANQPLVTSVFSNNNQITNKQATNSLQYTPVDIMVESIQSAYKNGFLTSGINTQNESIQDSITKLAYLISNEYSYSTKFKDFTNFGYTAKNGKNFEMWDYLIGQVGVDVTDINPTPLGQGNSLISLAQSVENNNVEVLTFEDRYIVDNVGVARNAILTPGTYYYLESSINTDSANFDFSRLNVLLQKLKTVDSMLNSVTELFDFRSTVPYGSVSKKLGIEKDVKRIGGLGKDGKLPIIPLTKKKEIPEKSLDASKDEDFLSNPLLLIREIENRILSNSPLLDREGQKLWSTTNDMSNSPRDISWLLINLSFENKSFRSLLFCYVMSLDVMERKKLIIEKMITMMQKIIPAYSGPDIIPNYDSPDPDDPYASSGEAAVNTKAISLQRIRQALTDSDEFYDVQILRNISSFIKEIDGKGTGNSAAQIFNRPQEVRNSQVKSTKERNFFVSDDSIGKQEGINLGNKTSYTQYYDNKVTFYSGVQRTTICLVIFELCCLMIQSLAPEKVLYVAPSEGNYGGEDLAPEGGLFDDSIYDYQNQNFGVESGAVTFEKTGNSILPYKNPDYPQLIFYNYDQMIVDAENQLYSISKAMVSRINRIRSFVSTLKISLENFRSLLQNNDYGSFIRTTNELLQDPAITNLLMTQEQMALVSSKLFDVASRSAPNYETPVKKIVPYFSSQSDNANIEKLLPIEDVGLVSWDLFLKEHLKGTQFRKSVGFNKKIISVGIPQKLYRSLLMDGSNLGSSSIRNGIIKLKIYRIDSLRPDLIHQPLSFLFDIRRFATRTLGNYQNAESLLNGLLQFDFFKVPSLVAGSSFNNFKVSQGFSDAFDENYDFLSSQEKLQIYNNHTNSFLMEQYFSFLSDTKVDENRYTNFSLLKGGIDIQFQNFVAKISSQTGKPPPPTQTFNPSASNFYLRDTYLLPNINSFFKELISPRKFDRVFHLVVDPDDFIIDTNSEDDSLATSPTAINRYKNKIELIDKSKPNSGYKRAGTGLFEITFDNYFAAVESYDHDSNDSV